MTVRAQRVARLLAWLAALALSAPILAAGGEVQAVLKGIGAREGICVVLGPAKPGFAVDLAKGSEMLVYYQSPEAKEVDALRQAAEAAGLLGRRIFADQGSYKRVHLADNLADGVVVLPGAEVPESEFLRVLRPGGRALVGDREIVKPVPKGTDGW